MTSVTSRRYATDRHASPASLPPAARKPWRWQQYEPDAIERVCVFCTLEQSGGEWTHNGSCPAAAAARRKRAG